MSTPLLELRNLTVRYGGIQALHGISLSVPQGSIVTLIGANGAGKSTTLRTISGLADAGLGVDPFRRSRDQPANPRTGSSRRDWPMCRREGSSSLN